MATSQDMTAIWKSLLDKIDSEDHLLSCKLSEAKVVSLNSRELAIGFNGGMSVLATAIEKSFSIINPILKQISGHNLKLKILSLPKNKSKNNIKEMKEEVFSEPIVKDAMKHFNSSLIKIKPLDNYDNMD